MSIVHKACNHTKCKKGVVYSPAKVFNAYSHKAWKQMLASAETSLLTRCCGNVASILRSLASYDCLRMDLSGHRTTSATRTGGPI